MYKENDIDAISINLPVNQSMETEPEPAIYYEGTIHEDFFYNRHNESIFDDCHYFPSLKNDDSDEAVVKFDVMSPEEIASATLKALIVQLTSPEVIDYNLICDFFLSFRNFTKPQIVLKLLITRLIWSLQYINSWKADTEQLGKLVLLRTFVVLRHWILNYFVDDFEPDEKLCDYFTTNINAITMDSGLIKPTMTFELKIFSDLKVHWLTQLNVFFPERNFPTENVETTPLPLASDIFDAKKLTKSPTEASIHTNPSYRRSAMLSLYDQKAHHKIPIYDLNSTDENPQLSISNLLTQHKSSRQSLNIKLEDFNKESVSPHSARDCLARQSNLAFTATPVNNRQRLSRQPNPGFQLPIPSSRNVSVKHNYTNLSDSSLALKKTKPNDNSQKPSTHPEVGFSTNGLISLPSSRIQEIIPATPVKKMDENLFEHSPLKKRIQGLKHPYAPPRPLHLEDEVGRKRSFKKVVASWTKNFHTPDLKLESETFSQLQDEEFDDQSSERGENFVAAEPELNIGDRVDILSARIIDELEYVIRYYINDSGQTITENTYDEINKSAIEFSPKQQEKNAEQKKSISLPEVESDTSEKHLSAGTSNELSIQDISELNIQKIDNLFSHEQRTQKMDTATDIYADTSKISSSSKRSSFGKATSINWNDEGHLLLENSALLAEDDVDSRPGTKYFDVTSEKEEHSVSQDPSRDQKPSFAPELSEQSGEKLPEIPSEKPSERHSQEQFKEQPPEELFRKGHSEEHIEQECSQNQEQSPQTKETSQNSQSYEFDSSDLECYNEEVDDLGIAMSPQSMRHRLQRISLNEQIASSSMNKRLSAVSRNSSGSLYRRNSSVKSYVSYDSAYSVFSDLKADSAVKNTNLKKKFGCNDLRKFAEIKDEVRLSKVSNYSIKRNVRASGNSFLSRSSSAKKSVRTSTLYALTELPFSQGMVYPKMALKDSRRLSELSDSSVFSQMLRGQKKKSTVNETSLKSSLTSVAIPGISNHVLKELASIPDETFTCKNPVQYALYKLEGMGEKEYENVTIVSSTSAGNVVPEAPVSPAERHASNRYSTVQVSPSDELFKLDAERREAEIYLDAQIENELIAAGKPGNKTVDTEQILDEINNAVTEDAIDYSSEVEVELKKRPVTPIKTSERLPISTSRHANNLNAIFSANSNSESPYSVLSPQVVFDGYSLKTSTLNIEHVMAEKTHVSFILSYSAKSIAEHFTLIEKDMLQEIDWKELIELKWNKDLTPVNSWLGILVNEDYYNKNKGVNLVISRFNLVVNWVISEILLTAREDERRIIISRMIHVAYHCYEMQNFSTLMQLILAITSEKINKLKDTWKHLPPGDILTLKHLEQLTSPMRNFVNIRLCTNQITPSKGCIPFVGLYLSDLVFNAERPKFIKDKTPSRTNTTNETSFSSAGSREDEIMINFSRFRTSVHIVKSLSQSIEWAANYDFPVDQELLRKCLYVKSLDEGEMNHCVEILTNK